MGGTIGIYIGEQVRFKSNKGNMMLAEVVGTSEIAQGKVSIQILGDPFPVDVEYESLSPVEGKEKEMPKKNDEMTAKQLRDLAKNLSVEGWEEMGREELRAAVTAAQEGNTDKSKKGGKDMAKVKTSTKVKTKASKGSVKTKTETKPAKGSTKPAKAAKPAKETAKPSGPNPFREGTNRWLVAEHLLAGGKRADMIKSMRKKYAYNGGIESLDAVIDHEILDVSSILRNTYGYEVVQEGRGREANIKAIPA